MKIKTKMLQDYLQEKNLTIEQLADDIQIGVAELTKLLNGESVEIQSASLFIHHFGADKAQSFIDWVAIGKKNPLASELPQGDVHD